MTNPVVHAVEEVGRGLKVVSANVAKAVVWLPKHIVQAVRVLDAAMKDAPPIKEELKVLVTKMIALDALVTKDIEERGLSIPDDLATLAAIKDLLQFLRGEFFEAISNAYGDLAEAAGN